MNAERAGRWVWAGVLGLGWLVGCSSQPPTPSWALEAQSATQRAVQADLQGQRRVAEVEWRKAFAEVAATGQPAAMARVALLQCAVQAAVVAPADCPRYQRYAAGAAPAEQAYARYLQARHTPDDVGLLPAAQQATAQALLASAPVGQLPATQDPLSALTAAGVALRAGQLAPAAVPQAAALASAQGWRKAALAWLLVQQRLAEQAGDAAQVQALQLRLQVLQEDVY